MRRASRAVTKLYGQFMAATGLEPTQYSLLVACALSGGATVSKLADAFVMDRSALAWSMPLDKIDVVLAMNDGTGGGVVQALKARNLNGKVIMYADTVTGSMERMMGETSRSSDPSPVVASHHSRTTAASAPAPTSWRVIREGESRSAKSDAFDAESAAIYLAAAASAG